MSVPVTGKSILNPKFSNLRIDKRVLVLIFFLVVVMASCASPNKPKSQSEAEAAAEVSGGAGSDIQPPEFFLPAAPSNRSEAELWQEASRRAVTIAALEQERIKGLAFGPIPDEFWDSVKQKQEPAAGVQAEAVDKQTPDSKTKKQLSGGTEVAALPANHDADGSSDAGDAEENKKNYKEIVFPALSIDRIYTKEDGLPSDSISSIYVDENDAWIGTHRDGLARLNFQEGNWLIVKKEDGLVSDRITDIIKYKDAVYVGTQDGINVWDGISWETIEKFGGTKLVNTVFKVNNGLLWVAARTMHGGLLTYDGETWRDKSTIKPGTVLNNVTSLDFEGDYLWIGTTNRGIYGFDGKRWASYTVAQGLASNFVYALAAGNKACYLGGCCGVSILENGKWKIYDIAEGLPHSTVNVVAVDKGVAWFGTKKGLALFDGYEFMVFSTSDGLPDERITEIFMNGTDAWIGTHQGLVKLRMNY